MQITNALIHPDAQSSPYQRPVNTDTTGGGGTVGAEPVYTGTEEAAASASSFKYRRSERTTLHIQTKEGDMVRLKFSTRDAVRLQMDPAAGDDGEGGMVFAAKSSSNLLIKVRGDLNAEELAAIQTTVDRAMDVAGDFFAGDLQSAFESVAAMDVDGDQLARVRLDMRLKERFSYSVPAPRLSPPVTDGGDPDAPPVDAGDGLDFVDGPVPLPVPPVEETDDAGEVRIQPVDETVQVAEEPGADDTVPAERPNPFAAIGDFLGRLLDAFSASQDDQSASLLDMSLKIRIAATTITTLAESRPADEGPLPALVPETLEALASLEQAPMNKVA